MDAQVGIPYFHCQVGGQVVHQTIAQLRIGIAKHHHSVARQDTQLGAFLRRADGSGTQPFIHQRHLAKALAAPQDGYRDHVAQRLRSADRSRVNLDFHFAMGDDIKFFAAGAFLQNDFPMA